MHRPMEVHPRYLKAYPGLEFTRTGGSLCHHRDSPLGHGDSPLGLETPPIGTWRVS
jgi:hypothetical protein